MYYQISDLPKLMQVQSTIENKIPQVKPEIAGKRHETQTSNLDSRKISAAQIEKLQRQLERSGANDSLNSFEGLHEAQETKAQVETEKKKELSKIDNLLQTTVTIIGYGIASSLHTIAALDRTLKFLPRSLSKLIDDNVQYISKLVNTGVFLSKSINAFGAKRGCDGLGRLLNPLAVWFAPQEDMYLASGLSSGSTMINFSQKHLNDDDYEPETNRQNLNDHFKAYGQKWKELIQDGFFGSKSKLTLNRSKNQGHLMFLGGNLNFLGAALGMTIGQGSHSLKAFGSIVRNTGSVVCDVAKMIDEDINFVKAGIIYGIVSIFDVWQALISNKEKSRTLSHITQALNNCANYFYTKPSDKAVDKHAQRTSLFEVNTIANQTALKQHAA